MLSRRTLLSSLAGGACLGLGGPIALAQSYPTRAITIVVPFPPGSNADVILRTIADRLQRELGQSAMVEHRPGGAGGTVGTKSVAIAEPDGHTLLFSTPGPLVIAPAVYKDIGYDAATAFAPIASIFSTPQVLAINPGLPARTMQELVGYAKANPGVIKYASPGFGTQPHLLGEMLKLQTGIDIIHVPYKGPAQIVSDLIAGHIHMNFETAPLILPQAETGKVLALAVADGRRLALAPDLPTTTEAGFPNLQATFWTGMLAPAGTPAPVIERLNAAINATLATTEVQTSLARLGARPLIDNSRGFGAFIASEARKWQKVASEAKVAA